MSKWEKLNKELDDALNSMTSEDWDKWHEKFKQRQHVIDLMRLDEQETFIKPDTIDGGWLSPVPAERQWQEEKLREITGHYPTASPKWQYMNGLIQNSLDAREMYSEEEVVLLLHKRDKHNFDNPDTFKGWETPKEWFEQFKKK